MTTVTKQEETPTCSPQTGIHLPAAPPLDLRAEPEVCGRLPADRREPCFTSVSDLWASSVLPISDPYEPTSSYIRAGLETRQDCVCECVSVCLFVFNCQTQADVVVLLGRLPDEACRLNCL